MILGLEDGKVALYPHDAEWEKTAQETIARICSIMGEDALDLQHIGGTSITCAYAKPIIDIQVLVKDFSVVDRYLPALEKMGMEYFGLILPRQAMGVLRTPDGKGQTHHIHFHVPEGEAWEETINIRDLCNSDPLAGKVYSDSKLEYAKGNEEVRLNYREEKNNMYVVLRQVGQARKEREAGLKSGTDFIDDFFYAALGHLEDIAVKDNDRAVKYKELCGLAVRAAVKLKQNFIARGSWILLAMEDSVETIAAFYAILYYGCSVILMDPSADEMTIRYLQEENSAALVIRRSFFFDIMEYREHRKEAPHTADDPACITAEDAFYTYGKLSAAVQETAASADFAEPLAVKPGDLSKFETLKQVLACLSKGGRILLGKE